MLAASARVGGGCSCQTDVPVGLLRHDDVGVTVINELREWMIESLEAERELRAQVFDNEMTYCENIYTQEH